MPVAALVLKFGGGEDAAIGRLLHDAVEDGEDGAEMERRIRGEFDNHVAGIVVGCSDAVAVPWQPKPPGGTASRLTSPAWRVRTTRPRHCGAGSFGVVLSGPPLDAGAMQVTTVSTILECRDWSGRRMPP
jgi:hypothetical protein